MDPHSQWLDTNTAYYNHIYGALTKIDEKSQIGPDLAESWQTPSDNEWHFKLRPGVKFHNGQPLTAKDVVASIKRALTLPNATSPYTGAIATVEGGHRGRRLDGRRSRRRAAIRRCCYGLGNISIIPASLGERHHRQLQYRRERHRLRSL